MEESRFLLKTQHILTFLLVLIRYLVKCFHIKNNGSSTVAVIAAAVMHLDVVGGVARALFDLAPVLQRQPRPHAAFGRREIDRQRTPCHHSQVVSKLRRIVIMF